LKVSRIIKSFLRDDRGLETVEYAIITGIIVAGTIALIVTIGDWVNGAFQAVADELPAQGG